MPGIAFVSVKRNVRAYNFVLVPVKLSAKTIQVTIAVYIHKYRVALPAGGLLQTASARFFYTGVCQKKII